MASRPTPVYLQRPDTLPKPEMRQGPAVRPKDAATLVLIQAGPRGDAVLMGRRHQAHRFMPDLWVFPGGKLDRGDFRMAPARALRPHVAARLGKGCDAGRAQALALAAIRETFEETGLALGAKAAPAGAVPKAWRDYVALGLAPALDRLDFICRAITPPYVARRFDARFFLTEATEDLGPLGGTGELVDLAWFPLAEIAALKLPIITRMVLDVTIARLAEGRPGSLPDIAVPFFAMRNRKHSVIHE